MDYATFKPLFGLLMFGAAFAFGFAQLASLRADRRKRESSDDQPDD